jgi:hypothetical protein
MTKAKLRGEPLNFPYRGQAWLYRLGDHWFAVWQGIGPGNQQESLGFRCDEVGQVSDWNEVVRRRTVDDVVAELERRFG